MLDRYACRLPPNGRLHSPLGDEISGTPEVEVRECFAEIGHECLDVIAAATRLVQRAMNA
jgi:hypothetical protein